MPSAVDISAVWVSFGAVLAVLLAVIEIFPVRTPGLSWLYSGTLAAIGFLQGIVYWQGIGGSELRIFPLVLYLPAPFILLLGSAIASEDFRLSLRHTWYFLPASLAAVAMLIPAEIAPSLRKSMVLAAPVYTILYLIPLGRLFGGVRKKIARAIIILFIADTATVAVLFGFHRPDWAAWVVSAAVCLIAAVRIKYPELLTQLRSEVAAEKYARSKLTGLDADSLSQKLTGLMETQRLYARDDLKLGDLATQLSLTPHQLSELINRKFSLGFFAFINRYRVEEAKRLLTEGEQNVLEIAMQVGFNNKSSFNESFTRFAGCTPVEYRKKKPL